MPRLRGRGGAVVRVSDAVAARLHGYTPLDQPKPSQAPAKSALKPEWVDYAVSQGMDPEEAEAASKADLQKQYG